MAVYAKDIVNQAKAWLGKKEKDGSFKVIIDTYNSHLPRARGYKVKYTDEWCSTFVSAVAIKCNATHLIPTECGCEKHTQLFKKIGAWVENENRTPNAGDIIFYDWNDNGKGDDLGAADHIGIVEKVSGKTITVIEGNYNEAVKRRTIKVNARYIRGYGVPKYDKEPVKAKPVKKEPQLENAKSFNEKIAGQYKTKANLHLRLGPSILKKSILVMPKNATVTNYGYYTGSWYLVKYGDKTGFCSKSYLKRK
jgi:hypothetical protein